MSKLRTFWGWEVIKNKITIKMIFTITYKWMTWHIHITSVILHQSGTKRCVKHAESCPVFAWHVEIRDNYKREEWFSPLASKRFSLKRKT